MGRGEGKVYLVGAGPGDVGLLTLRARECLAEADAVVYDRLVNPELLHFAPDHCQKIYVGKTPGRYSPGQEDISRLLVELAGRGWKVVRLKGGDPFVFGRGGEEALALREAGIPFEVVPGVTAATAVPAYAGIPVTHRGLASTVAFITGNEDPAKGESHINWKELARSADTLVFLMGMANLSQIVSQLLLHGRAPDTPVALVRWGSRAEQETLVGTLLNIEARAQQASFSNPAVIIVGEVVKLRDKLAWWEHKPLAGRRIVVTRPHPQGEAMVRRLGALGAEVIRFPTIAIAPPDDWGPLDRAVDDAENFDWIVFTSANGVQYFWERLVARGKDARRLAGVKIAAIGPATAEALARRGITADHLPGEYVAEAIARDLGPKVRGKRVLLPRADIARPALAEDLRRWGAEVAEIAAYRTVKSPLKGEGLRHLLEAGKISAVTFTSASTVRNFLEIIGPEADSLLGRTAIASIGPITSAEVRRAGLKVSIEAEVYTEEGLVAALLAYFAPRYEQNREGR
ncbi:uroporphyrinogen-III C-methyltransferase [Thermanaeromonas sp. C210]|uniref:uroporphyrinogen-III C-methyltransferase n=1 Tax=Thermanaeromonas sp. C210 TaxID=2731925 RepID=UPI00155C3CC6|nr:uroporphyrinogen-III C-methyltransferase [Thermanaeromonas sp. C210]GFN23576.1 uroporphyrinogen III methyltransferase [Thermanaeromonas sp. C210]